MNTHYLRTGLISLLMLLAAPAKATELVHVFTFDSGLNDYVGEATLENFGGTVSDGLYNVDVDQGLSITSTEFDSTSYSIEMIFRFDSFLTTWKKVIDTNTLTLDEGIYLRGSSVYYYAQGESGPTTLVEGEDIHLVMSRDASGETRTYINGVFQFGTTPLSSAALNNTLYFFQDDTVTNNEEAPGSVDLIRIYNGALTPAQASALSSNTTLLTEHDLTDSADGLVTREITTNNEWLDLPLTTNTSINDISADVGGWQSSGFRVATTSEVRALWHATGLVSFNDLSVENASVIENYHELLGCTLSCDGSGVDRATGMYIENPTITNGIGLIQSEIHYNASPVDAEAYRLGSTFADNRVSSWGVYLIREQLVEDTDGDGIDNQFDNCIEHSNADQTDSDRDGYGNRCDPDFDNSGTVNFVDVSSWAPFFNTSGSGVPDLNNDGVFNFLDFTIITGFYLQPPGPSAFHSQ